MSWQVPVVRLAPSLGMLIVAKSTAGSSTGFSTLMLTTAMRSFMLRPENSMTTLCFWPPFSM